MIGLFLGDTDFSELVLKEIMILTDAYKEIFKNENLTENLNNLSKDFKSNELVAEVIGFIEKDKKRPICTPFSK